MKVALIGILLLLIGVGGFVGYQMMAKNGEGPPKQQASSATKTGTIKKAVPPGDDYTHVLIGTDGTTKLNSQRVSLSNYEDEKVTVKGAYSGNTLYVDEITQE